MFNLLYAGNYSNKRKLAGIKKKIYPVIMKLTVF